MIDFLFSKDATRRHQVTPTFLSCCSSAPFSHIARTSDMVAMIFDLSFSNIYSPRPSLPTRLGPILDVCAIRARVIPKLRPLLLRLRLLETLFLSHVALPLRRRASPCTWQGGGRGRVAVAGMLLAKASWHGTVHPGSASPVIVARWMPPPGKAPTRRRSWKDLLGRGGPATQRATSEQKADYAVARTKRGQIDTARGW